MSLKTLQEWNEVGRRIRKGSKSVSRNEAGIPVFDEYQTRERISFSLTDDGNDFDEDYDDAFAGEWGS